MRMATHPPCPHSFLYRMAPLSCCVFADLTCCRGRSAIQVPRGYEKRCRDLVCVRARIRVTIALHCRGANRVLNTEAGSDHLLSCPTFTYSRCSPNSA
ncbi:hypothetical protein E2C01_018335 [Portunus trituberculatus]|uniref:Uncharacterized protein n=1 Tax=Portunus trituberculatus TaxID=210409 RepID=A0A5B7DUR9_PORTR|nr:hypothetical protein [Portunus trituberculatus]